MRADSYQRRLVVTLAALVSVVMVLRAAPAADVAVLAVEGRANSTPSIAAAGSFVAVAWGATDSAGKTDVFLAVSRDGGVTFGNHVRVNSAPGTARLGGELPPRVALAPPEAGKTTLPRASSSPGDRRPRPPISASHNRMTVAGASAPRHRCNPASPAIAAGTR